MLQRIITQPPYADMTAEEAAAALNAPGESTQRSLPVKEIMAYGYSSGLYPRLVAAQRNPNLPDDLYAMVTSLLDLKTAGIDAITVTDPAATAMLAGLEAAGLLNKNEKAALLALAVVPGQSEAQRLGLGIVTAEAITAARAAHAAEENERARRAAWQAERERVLIWLRQGEDGTDWPPVGA